MKLTLGAAPHLLNFDFTIPQDVEGIGPIAKIGVYLSGGLDSSALLGLVLSELKATNRMDKVQVHCFTAIKADGSTYYAKRMIQKFSECFAVPLVHVNNVENDPEAFAAGRLGLPVVKSLRAEHEDMLFYLGINRMVAPEINTFKNTLKIVYREGNSIVRTPFLNMMKPQILDIYYQLGFDEVISYTHSCTVWPVGKCGNCYSCEERSWGFEALGKTETETVPPEVSDISFGRTWRLVE